MLADCDLGRMTGKQEVIPNGESQGEKNRLDGLRKQALALIEGF
jgi:hypothetical protein